MEKDLVKIEKDFNARCREMGIAWVDDAARGMSLAVVRSVSGGSAGWFPGCVVFFQDVVEDASKVVLPEEVGVGAHVL
ncbi:MAG: hypothetical protein J6Y37_11550 [Paludibacteraceae bacterium]|nr:hypothetical protein [Paludibacteraceae bacterium]